MRHVSVSAAALFLVGSAVAQVPRVSVDDEELSAPAPKAYIIEYSSVSAFSALNWSVPIS